MAHPVSRAAIFAMSIGALASWLMGALPARADVVDRVIATIDGEPIMESDLEAYARSRGDDPTARSTLTSLVTEQLLNKKAAELGIHVREEDIDRYIDDVRAERGLDEEAFAKALSERGVDLDRYRRDVRTELQRGELINREIRNRVNVSPEEVRRHYEAHADDYTLAERVRVRMIMIPAPLEAPPEFTARAEALVRSLYQRISAGEDFGTLAREYSHGPGAADGGDLGFFERGQMVQPLESVAFRLKAGSLSQPIRSPAGFHLMMIEEREGSVEQSFEDVEAQIREELYQAALQERYARWLKEDLPQAYHVEILW